MINQKLKLFHVCLLTKRNIFYIIQVDEISSKFFITLFRFKNGITFRKDLALCNKQNYF